MCHDRAPWHLRISLRVHPHSTLDRSCMTIGDPVRAPLCPAYSAAVPMLYLPLAIMGVRGRVRHQSVVRARSTKVLPVLPELQVTTAFPITLVSSCCRFRRARARRLHQGGTHQAAAPAATLERPCAR